MDMGSFFIENNVVFNKKNTIKTIDSRIQLDQLRVKKVGLGRYHANRRSP